MRLLKINGRNVDIDEHTAIGIDISCYDVKDPSVRKINTSNSFSIPRTGNNDLLFGLAGDVSATWQQVYELNSVEYYIDNEKFISGAKIKVDNVSDRINLTITSATTFFDRLKNLKGKSLFNLIHGYLISHNKGFTYPTDRNYYTLQQLIEKVALNKTGVTIPMTYGPMYDMQFENVEGTAIDNPPYSQYIESEFGGIKLRYPRLTENESGTKIIDSTVPPATGGHVYMFAHSFVAMLQWYFKVNLGVGVKVDGNLFDDANFKKIAFPVPAITLRTDGPINDRDHYFDVLPFNNDGTFSYLDPLNNVSLDGYNAYDILMSLVKMFSATIDKTDQGYLFRRLDQLEQYGKIVDFTNKLDADETIKCTPYITNYSQRTHVKYEKLEDGLSEFIGSKTIACNNKNLPGESDLFKVKNYVPKFGKFKDEIAPVMSKSNAMTSISFLYIDGVHSRPTKIALFSDFYTSTAYRYDALVNLPIASIYSMEGEFKFHDKINTNPRVYSAGFWLTSNDIRNIDNYTLIYVKQLGGCFYLNKISGFNPDMSKSSTNCELIKVNDKTPLNIAYVDAYLDGQGNQFTDGKGNVFI